jgi:hypothetical protein
MLMGSYCGPRRRVFVCVRWTVAAGSCGCALIGSPCASNFSFGRGVDRLGDLARLDLLGDFEDVGVFDERAVRCLREGRL